MAYQESYITIAKRRLARAYNVLRGRDLNHNEGSTVTGYLLDPSTDRHNRLHAEPLEQDYLTEELLGLLADFPVLEAALRKLCDLDEFNVSVKRSAGGELEAARANRILQRTKKNCELEKELSEITYIATGLGNAYLQPVLQVKEIVDLLLMPNLGFVRNTDHLDQFIPGKPNFIQRTAAYDEFYFTKGQVIQARFNHRRGQRYGSSIFFSGRSVSKDALAGLRSLLPRRLANQPFRHFNVAPNKGIAFTLFESIKKSLSRLLHVQKGGQTSPWDDVFTNNVEVEVLGGEDTNVGDLKDIELLIDSLLMLIGASRQVLGAGTNVNRDVMDEQREELYKHRRKIIKFVTNQILKPLFDLALALEGISPDTVEYTIDFPDLFTDSRSERRIDKLLAIYDRGLISEIDAIPVFAPYLGIKDIQGAISRIQAKPNQTNLITEPKQLLPQTQPDPIQPNPLDDEDDREDLTIN